MVKTYEKDVYKVMKRKLLQKKMVVKERKAMEESMSPTRKRRGTISFGTPQTINKKSFQLNNFSTKEESDSFETEMDTLSKLGSRFS